MQIELTTPALPITRRAQNRTCCSRCQPPSRPSVANDAATFTPRARASSPHTRQSKPRVVLYMSDIDGRRPPLCRPYERPRQPTSISYDFALIFVNDEGRRPEARFQSAHRAQQSGLAGDDCIRHLTSPMRQGLALIADVLESTFIQRKLA